PVGFGLTDARSLRPHPGKPPARPDLEDAVGAEAGGLPQCHAVEAGRRLSQGEEADGVPEHTPNRPARPIARQEVAQVGVSVIADDECTHTLPGCKNDAPGEPSR